MGERKIIVTAQPVLHTRQYEAGEPCYPSKALGNLLVRRTAHDVFHTLTKKDLDYIRGLADGGIMYAHELYDMLQKADEVHVSWHVEEPKKSGYL